MRFLLIEAFGVLTFLGGFLVLLCGAAAERPGVAGVGFIVLTAAVLTMESVEDRMS